MRNLKSIEINKILAEQAAGYSRRVIKKGSTQMSNNQLSLEQFDALSDAIQDNRDAVRQSSLPGVSLDLVGNGRLNYYEKIIEISKKSSLGNCLEMALQAFDYLLYHPQAINLNFEIFELTDMEDKQGINGHVFMVIGRPKEGSLNPKDWKEDVFIIDPWNDKKQVYSASEIVKNLKSWRREIIFDHKEDLVSVKNTLDDFDEKKHTLITGKKLNFTSDQMRQLRTTAVQDLTAKFLNEAKSILNLFSKLKFKLKVCHYNKPNVMFLDYLEKIALAERNLNQTIRLVRSGKMPDEFRMINQKLTRELENAYQLIYPSVELCSLMEAAEVTDSKPNLNDRIFGGLSLKTDTAVIITKDLSAIIPATRDLLPGSDPGFWQSQNPGMKGKFAPLYSPLRIPIRIGFSAKSILIEK